jgi:vanillate O-demethylase ferredoxin subunit
MNPSNAARLLELEVVDRRLLTADVLALWLRRADHGLLPAAAPGSHLEIDVLIDGRSERRCYSIVNASLTPHAYEIGVKLEVSGKGGSRYMHQLALGARLASSEPRNGFELFDGPHEAILIAGGIGITPILSMVRTLQAREAPYTLHYGARSAQAMAYREEILGHFASRSKLYFDDGVAEAGMKLRDVLGEPSSARHAYVCGPRPLLDATLHEARNLGWDLDHVHFELFGAPSPATGDGPISLTLARSGRIIEVAADASILDAMIEAGCDPMFDCKRGECSVCALKVLDGIADHRDYVLSEEDRLQGLLCVCVSRARTPQLTLDA